MIARMPAFTHWDSYDYTTVLTNVMWPLRFLCATDDATATKHEMRQARVLGPPEQHDAYANSLYLVGLRLERVP